MLPSPLQLNKFKFTSVSVVPRVDPEIHNVTSVFEPFRFENTRVLTSINFALAEDDPDSPQFDFLINFCFMLPDEGVVRPPYICDIKCVGYFSISKEVFPDPVARLDVGVVNGASMLYGMVRELVANITARSWYGEMLLPSSNFRDHAPSAGGFDVQTKKDKVEPSMKAIKTRSKAAKVAKSVAKK